MVRRGASRGSKIRAEGVTQPLLAVNEIGHRQESLCHWAVDEIGHRQECLCNIGGSMKAIRIHEFGGPEVLKLEDVPDLQAGAGQVVVGVKAAGVNPYDTYMRQGTYAIKPPLPYTPGSDAAGIVDSVGEGVQGIAAGDRVYVGGTLTGAYAGQTLAEAWQVHHLPPNVTFSQGAGVNVPYATAFRALFQIAHAAAGPMDQNRFRRLGVRHLEQSSEGRGVRNIHACSLRESHVGRQPMHLPGLRQRLFRIGAG